MPINQKTFNELKGLWETVGGPAGRSDVAAAIAFAESAGCQYALAGPVDIRPVKQCIWNKTDGENSAGYWQINLREHKQYSAPSIFDEYTNARAAVAISNHGSDFGAWSTYNNGSYLTYLRKYGGQAATAPPPAPTAPTPKGSTTDTIGKSWASGWKSLSTELGREMPKSLSLSRAYRRATLRKLAQARKVT